MSAFASGSVFWRTQKFSPRTGYITDVTSARSKYGKLCSVLGRTSRQWQQSIGPSLGLSEALGPLWAHRSCVWEAGLGSSQSRPSPNSCFPAPRPPLLHMPSSSSIMACFLCTSLSCISSVYLSIICLRNLCRYSFQRYCSYSWKVLTAAIKILIEVVNFWMRKLAGLPWKMTTMLRLGWCPLLLLIFEVTPWSP